MNNQAANINQVKDNQTVNLTERMIRLKGFFSCEAEVLQADFSNPLMNGKVEEEHWEENKVPNVVNWFNDSNINLTLRR